MKPTLQEHARQLAVAFKVRLIESDQLRPEEACAIPHMRIVLSAPIYEDLGYAVTLHEIGHLAAPTGALNVARTQSALLCEEDAAWAWARHYALHWTEPMEALAQWAEQTYRDNPPAAPRRSPPAPAAPKTKTPAIDWKRYER